MHIYVKSEKVQDCSECVKLALNTSNFINPKATFFPLTGQLKKGHAMLTSSSLLQLMLALKQAVLAHL